MPEDISTPVELGFTEFVGKLITDTFEAVIGAQATQEEQWIQLQETLQLDLQAFAEQVVDDRALSQRQALLFPDPEEESAIYKGRKYLKGNSSRHQPEDPPVFALTGYRPQGRSLSQEDVSAIEALIRMQMAERQRSILARVVQQGSTKVVVDGGRINAKLTFNIYQIKDADAEDPANSNNDSGGLVNSFARKVFVPNRNFLLNRAIPQPLQKVRFFVKPTSDQDPQTAQMKANV
jgi:hypothetical protein